MTFFRPLVSFFSKTVSIASITIGSGTFKAGATSVLAQLSCDVRVVRRVPPTVFHPAPKVESAIVALRRHSPPPSRELIALVHAGFAHRRKALAGSLALADGAPDGIRDRTRAALEELGYPADARAEPIAKPVWLIPWYAPVLRGSASSNASSQPPASDMISR